MSAADVIARPDTYSTYFSSRSDLTLVRVPQQRLYDQHGVVRGTTPPDRIAFRDNTLRTSDADEIEFLEGHRLFGDPFEGFVKQNMPAPAPTEEELLAITEVSQDREELLAILRAENAGYQRPLILRMCAAAIDRIDGVQAAPQAPQKGPVKAK